MSSPVEGSSPVVNQAQVVAEISNKERVVGKLEARIGASPFTPEQLAAARQKLKSRATNPDRVPVSNQVIVENPQSADILAMKAALALSTEKTSKAALSALDARSLEPVQE